MFSHDDSYFERLKPHAPGNNGLIGSGATARAPDNSADGRSVKADTRFGSVCVAQASCRKSEPSGFSCTSFAPRRETLWVSRCSVGGYSACVVLFRLVSCSPGHATPDVVSAARTLGPAAESSVSTNSRNTLSTCSCGLQRDTFVTHTYFNIQKCTDYKKTHVNVGHVGQKDALVSSPATGAVPGSHAVAGPCSLGCICCGWMGGETKI